MPNIPFPNVPAFPGVPSLATPPNTTFNTFVQLLTGDNPNINSLVAQPQWGIFDNNGGDAIIEADSVISVEHMKEYRTCEYPVEPNSTDNSSGQITGSASFETYNKVEMPYDIRIVFAKGGTDGDRTTFLSTIDGIAGDNNLYTVNTPDATYNNANIVRYDYRRTSQSGVTLLLVEVYVRQIRTSGSTTQFSQNTTADAASANTVNDGQINGQTPDNNEISTIQQYSI